jgi:hypothetical protein
MRIFLNLDPDPGFVEFVLKWRSKLKERLQPSRELSLATYTTNLQSKTGKEPNRENG